MRPSEVKIAPLMRISRETVRGCIVAIAAIALVVLFRQYYLETLFGQDAPLLLVFLPILAAAALGDWKSGLFATLTCAVVGTYFFVEHEGFYVPRAIDQARLVRLLIVGGILSWVFESLHAAQCAYEASIAEVLRKQAGLEEANRRKDEFLAMMAHELRNPLAPISNALNTWPLVEDDPVDCAVAQHNRSSRQADGAIDR